jgi:maltooligosyltrehalose trehalohydrolase
MPFGAQVLEDGRARFRLWAPAAKSVELGLTQPQGEDFVRVPGVGDGWHELVTDAAPGISYRYRINGELLVPDPASRFNAWDVEGPSVVVDPRAFDWKDGDWRGRDWREAVLYELHVGTFTRAGTFAGVKEHLDHLVDLGVTVIEMMPVAEFPGRHGWGYDGVLMFAPEADYGSPEDLKDLVQTAHAKGLMMILDVVYNHFGPEGNYLHVYAPGFFTERHHTPWGAAINFDGEASRTVRNFYVHNALYWLEEFHFDGLRFDAVHAVIDNSRPDILEEIAQAVHSGPGRQRRIHLILENDNNAARYLKRDSSGQPAHYTAQWDDDFHHPMHVVVTGQTDGYYVDYARDPMWHLGRSLAEGFSYQGEESRHREGKTRGEPSAELPPTAFISFLQNHDQVGNDAFGERLHQRAQNPGLMHCAVAILLLAPQPPLLFMGEEFAALQPFQYFCDFPAELGALVREGRRNEFIRFERFQDPEQRSKIPDPNDLATFDRSVLDWDTLSLPEQDRTLACYRELLALRHEHIVPRLAGIGCEAGFKVLGKRALRVWWKMGDGSLLSLLANFGEAAWALGERLPGRLLYATPGDALDALARGKLLPVSVAWFLDDS